MNPLTRWKLKRQLRKEEAIIARLIATNPRAEYVEILRHQGVARRLRNRMAGVELNRRQRKAQPPL